MRVRLLAVAGLCFAALALSGCPKHFTNGECEADENCKEQAGFENFVCIDKKCVQCSADAQCKAGEVCQHNACVPKPECSGPADCGAGKSCQAGKCVASNTCSKNTDCPSGKCLDGQCASANACKSTKDCTGKQTCQAGFCSEPVTEQCQLRKVQFGFNEATLDPSAQEVLKSDADCIQSRKLAVRLEGNADERGTEEYNLHLGERRAASVKTYLQKLGVESSKMKTISYGKERPVNPGHDEAAWAENRRVDVVEQ